VFLKERAELKRSLREFFDSRGFLEVDTPILVPYENPDDNVENVKGVFKDFAGRLHEWFLHTSPEFFMKRLVWHGVERCYQLCKVFRSGEITELHSIEFTMLEWYRVGADFEAGMKEVEELLKFVLESFNRSHFSFRGKRVFPAEPLHLEVSEAFRRFAGVKDVFDEEELKSAAETKSYEEAFFRLLIERVEPALLRYDVPVFLWGYPEPFSAMAKVAKGRAERFEVYVAGVEIANGYSELTDYDSYLEKFSKKGKNAVDCGFLELLKKKELPECEGVALGFDRLLMLVVGASELSEVVPFSTKELIESFPLPLRGEVKASAGQGAQSFFDHEVNELVNGLRFHVEPGSCRHYYGSGSCDSEHVLYVNLVEGSFAQNEDEPSALF